MIKLENVTKTFAGDIHAVSDLSLEIGEGEFVAFVGPSGCGKTTALRMIAGLETVTSGRITVANRDVTQADPGERDIAMVFQNYALYPHMTVRNNLAFGMKINRFARSEIAQRVDEVAKLIGLEEYLDRRPSQLSGGQRQRVAMGRALIRNPNAFLMDEPLSNLDAKLRVHMRVEVRRLQQEVGTTTVYVTHDQVEAMTMGDRIAVMRGGVLQQYGRPDDIYDRPANAFVAGFMGAPPMNLFRAGLTQDGTTPVLVVGEQTMKFDGRLSTDFNIANGAGKQVIVGLRPEDIVVDAAAGTLKDLRVSLVESLGAERIAHVGFGDAIKFDRTETGSNDIPDDMMLQIRLSRSTPVPELGSNVAIQFDPANLHLFDVESGKSLRRD
ncbi:ABC transporter ATP-binding protein [Cucumibacter marinus]|uniref:ABC transporter ATP-binding protein n=1 Tax=Cucumibacter marinus TaxID=1121252 RepID=UPI00040960A5|nr:sn-glycerol-3-phosphate ABC transporter ATP-binding protein UgpC [Cucumibacter marinus]